MMIAAALVFIMHLGFASVESGLTRAKNTTNILFKNTFVVCAGILTYALVGFNLMYPGEFNGYLGFAGFGLFGALAASRTAEAGLVVSLIGGAVAAGVGLFTLRGLLALGDRTAAAPVDDGRRAFLIGAASTFVASLLAGLIGRNLSESTTATVAARGEVALPEPVSPVSPPGPAMSLDVEGISPLVTPTSDFYRIDTAFVPPRVDAATWSMRINGMVDREIELTYDDLLGLDMVERYITIACVSNEVGGGLVGNAKWLGVPLRDVLDLAGVQSGAEQLVGRSVDRFTVGDRFLDHAVKAIAVRSAHAEIGDQQGPGLARDFCG
jgi:hypothetical protein